MAIGSYPGSQDHEYDRDAYGRIIGVRRKPAPVEPPPSSVGKYARYKGLSVYDSEMRGPRRPEPQIPLDLEPAPEPVENDWEVWDEFLHAFRHQNPQMIAGTLQMAGEMAGSDSIRNWGRELEEWARSGADESLRPGVPRDLRDVEWTDADSIQRYVSALIGQGVASMVPSLAMAGIGGVGGAVVGGPPGAVVGTAAGAFVGSSSMVGGELFLQLRDELIEGGMDPQQASKEAAGPAAAMTPFLAALDSLPVTKATAPLARGLRREAVKNLAERVTEGNATQVVKEVGANMLSRAVQVGLAEGVTETAQQALMEATVALKTGNPRAEERAWNVINAFPAGFFAGAPVGGASAAAEPAARALGRPFQPGEPETETERDAIVEQARRSVPEPELGRPAPPRESTLDQEDLASPVGEVAGDLIDEGREFVDELIGAPESEAALSEGGFPYRVAQPLVDPDGRRREILGVTSLDTEDPYTGETYTTRAARVRTLDDDAPDYDIDFAELPTDWRVEPTEEEVKEREKAEKERQQQQDRIKKELEDAQKEEEVRRVNTEKLALVRRQVAEDHGPEVVGAIDEELAADESLTDEGRISLFEQRRKGLDDEKKRREAAEKERQAAVQEAEKEAQRQAQEGEKERKTRQDARIESERLSNVLSEVEAEHGEEAGSALSEELAGLTAEGLDLKGLTSFAGERKKKLDADKKRVEAEEAAAEQAAEKQRVAAEEAETKRREARAVIDRTLSGDEIADIREDYETPELAAAAMESMVQGELDGRGLEFDQAELRAEVQKRFNPQAEETQPAEAPRPTTLGRAKVGDVDAVLATVSADLRGQADVKPLVQSVQEKLAEKGLRSTPSVIVRRDTLAESGLTSIAPAEAPQEQPVAPTEEDAEESPVGDEGVVADDDPVRAEFTVKRDTDRKTAKDALKAFFKDERGSADVEVARAVVKAAYSEVRLLVYDGVRTIEKVIAALRAEYGDEAYQRFFKPHVRAVWERVRAANADQEWVGEMTPREGLRKRIQEASDGAPTEGVGSETEGPSAPTDAPPSSGPVATGPTEAGGAPSPPGDPGSELDGVGESGGPGVSGGPGGGAAPDDRSGSRRTDGAPTDGSDGATAPEGEGPLRPDEEGGGVTASVARDINDGNAPYVITEDEAASLIEGSPRERALRNVDILTTLRDASEEGLTGEQKRLVAGYTGWGIAKNVFQANRDRQKPWERHVHDALVGEDGQGGLLTREQYQEAQYSLLNANYTDPATVRHILNLVAKLGIEGGTFLEPSGGSGLFIGVANDVIPGARWVANDLDGTSARVMDAVYGGTAGAEVHNADFANLPIREGSVDVAISNVPFGSMQLSSPDVAEGSRQRIHNYFLLKMVKATRPGGIIAAITTSGFLDKSPPGVRERIQEDAELVVAERLPEDYFKQSAGADVTVDIIVWRKRGAPDAPPLPRESFAKVLGKDYQREDHRGPVEGTDRHPLNEYFIRNPDRVRGRLVSRAKRRGTWELVTLARGPRDREPAEISTGFENIVAGEPASGPVVSVEEAPAAEARSVDTEYGERLATLAEGTRELGSLIRSELDSKKAAEAADERRSALFAEYGQLRDAIGKPLSGYLHANRDLYNRESVETKLLFSLETELPDQKGPYAKRKFKPSAFLTRSAVADFEARQTALAKASGDEDAIARTLNAKGRLDLAYVAEILGEEERAVTERLLEAGHVVAVPAGESDREYHYAPMYLSGAVGTKLDDMNQVVEDRAAHGDDVTEFRRTIHRLEDALPPRVSIENIELSFAQVRSGIIPVGVLSDMLSDLFSAKMRVYQGRRGGRGKRSDEPYLHVRPQGYFDRQASVLDRQEYGLTLKIDGQLKTVTATDMIEAMINGDNLPILEQHKRNTDGSVQYTGGKNPRPKTELSPLGLTEGHRKAGILGEKLKQYLLGNKEAATKVEDIFNRRLNRYVAPQIDDSWLQLEGLNPSFVPWGHQRAAVAKGIQSRFLYVAHEVGLGKTETLVMLAHEHRRMGLARSPLLVVPKDRVSGFAGTAEMLYPGIRVHVIETTDKGNARALREQAISELKGRDFDLAVMSRDAFISLRSSPEMLRAAADAEVVSVQEETRYLAMTAAQQAAHDKAQRDKFASLAEEHSNEEPDGTDSHFFFEDLGVDAIYVDEAHNYKNQFAATTQRQDRNNAGIAGLGGGPDGAGADKQHSGKQGASFIAKVAYLQATGGRVVLASGTPFSNSYSEYYTMLRYLMTAKQREAVGITSFDEFIANYLTPGTRNSPSQLAVGLKAQTEIVAWRNKTQLAQLMSSVMDVVTASDAGLKLPPMETDPDTGSHWQILELEPSDSQVQGKEFADEMYKWAKNNPKAASGFSAFLISGGWGTNLTLSPKLVAGDSSFFRRQAASVVDNLEGVPIPSPEFLAAAAEDLGPKLTRTADIVAERYHKSTPFRGVALIFSDIDAPQTAVEEQGARGPTRFSLKKAITQELVKRGVKESEIATIPKSAKARDKLSERINAGEVRVMLGSTTKGGTGINVQQRVVTNFSIDATWTSVGMEQRDGRSRRSGNKIELLQDELGIPRDEQMKLGTFVTVVEESTDAHRINKVATKSSGLSTILDMLRGRGDLELIQDEARVKEEAYAMMAAAAGNEDMTRLMEIDRELRIKQQEVETASEIANRHDADMIRLRRVLATATPEMESRAEALVAWKAELKKPGKTPPQVVVVDPLGNEIDVSVELPALAPEDKDSRDRARAKVGRAFRELYDAEIEPAAEEVRRLKWAKPAVSLGTLRTPAGEVHLDATIIHEEKAPSGRIVLTPSGPAVYGEPKVTIRTPGRDSLGVAIGDLIRRFPPVGPEKIAEARSNAERSLEERTGLEDSYLKTLQARQTELQDLKGEKAALEAKMLQAEAEAIGGAEENVTQALADIPPIGANVPDVIEWANAQLLNDKSELWRNAGGETELRLPPAMLAPVYEFIQGPIPPDRDTAANRLVRSLSSMRSRLDADHEDFQAILRGLQLAAARVSEPVQAPVRPLPAAPAPVRDVSSASPAPARDVSPAVPTRDAEGVPRLISGRGRSAVWGVGAEAGLQPGAHVLVRTSRGKEFVSVVTGIEREVSGETVYRSQRLSRPESSRILAAWEKRQRRMSSGRRVRMSAERREALRGDMERIGRHLFGEGFSLEHTDDIPHAQGMVVRMALDAQDANTTFGHEGIHVLRGTGAFTDAEWTALQREAENDWIERYRIAEEYPELDHEAHVEESVAEAFGDYYHQIAGSGLPTIIKRAILAVRRFLRQIYRALVDGNYLHPEDVFHRIVTGQVAGSNRAAAARAGLTPEGAERVATMERGARQSDPGVLTRAAKFGRWLKSGTRYYANLPHNEHFAAFFEWDSTRQGAFNEAIDRTDRYLHNLLDGLTREQAKVLRWAIVSRDLTWRRLVEEQTVALEDEDLGALRAYVDKALADPKNNVVHERLRLRDQELTRIRKLLVDAEVARDEDMRNPAYFRHMVLDFMQARDEHGGKLGGALRLRRWERSKGSLRLINMNLAEAEVHWMMLAASRAATNHMINRDVKGSKYDHTAGVASLKRGYNRLVAREAIAKLPKDSRELAILKAAAGKMAIGFSTIARNVKATDVPADLRPMLAGVKAGKGAADAREESAMPLVLWLASQDEGSPGLVGARSVLAGLSRRRQLLLALTKGQALALDNARAYAKMRDMAPERLRKALGQVPGPEKGAADAALKLLALGGLGAWQPNPGFNLFVSGTRSDAVRDAMAQDPSTFQPGELRKAVEAARSELMGIGIPTEVVEDALADLNNIHLSVMRVGRPTLILEAGIADTLTEMQASQWGDALLWQAVRKSTALWKTFKLLWPLSVVGYNIRNVSGDMDIVFASYPDIITTSGGRGKIRDAVRMLLQFQLRKSGEDPPPIYREALSAGVVGTGITRADILSEWDVELTEMLEQFREDGSASSQKKWVRRFWSKTKALTNLREDALRLALYMHLREKVSEAKTTGEAMQRLGQVDETAGLLARAIGTTKTGGANPKMARGIVEEQGPAALAAFLTRETLIDYRRISRAGSALRQSLIPFWSFQEGNFRRYWNITRGIVMDHDVRGGARVGAAAALGVTKVGATIAFRTFAFTAMLYAADQFARWASGCKEDTAGPENILKDGVTLYCAGGQRYRLPLPGALSDYLGWIGFPDVVTFLKQRSFADTSQALAETASEIFMTGASKAVNSLNPLAKWVLEATAGKKMYPRIDNARPLTDRGLHAMETFLPRGADLAWRWSKGTTESEFAQWDALAAATGIKRRDEDEAIWYWVRSDVRAYAESVGIERPSGGSTEEAALWVSYRKAVRLGNKRGASQILESLREYADDVNERRPGRPLIIGRKLAQMHRALDPLGYLSKPAQAGYMAQLTPDEKKWVERAYRYATTIAGRAAGSDK